MLAGGAASAAALWHVYGAAYYPVVRVATPEGLTFTAFSAQTRGRAECAAANERFLEPIRKDCPTCEVLSSACEGTSEGRRLRNALEDPVVLSGGLSVAVAGPSALAVATCKHLASDLQKRGIAGSRCRNQVLAQ